MNTITIFAVVQANRGTEFGENWPNKPALFTTNAEAEAHADQLMREAWLDFDAEDNGLGPYPDDWRKADKMLGEDQRKGDYGWGYTDIVEVPVAMPTPEKHTHMSTTERDFVTMIARLETVDEWKRDYITEMHEDEGLTPEELEAKIEGFDFGVEWLVSQHETLESLIEQARAIVAAQAQSEAQ